jgi:hypothetical protein
MGVGVHARFRWVLLAVGLIQAHATLATQPALVAAESGLDWNRVLSLPREEAIALAYLPEYARFRPGILNLVFRMWALEDPPAAHARLLTLAGELDIAPTEIQIIEQWLRFDPPTALAAAAESVRPMVLPMALAAFARQAPTAALEVTHGHAAMLAPAELGLVIGAVAGSDPLLAAEYTASLGAQGAALVEYLIHALARMDPAYALDWLQQHYPDQISWFEGIASVYFIADPARAFAYLEGMEPGSGQRVFADGLCRAMSVNAESRARSALPQPPEGYDLGWCQTEQ